MDWLNVFGLIIVVLILVPNMIYACKNKKTVNKCKNQTMNIIEQIGRYGSMFLMVFNIGIAEFGFRSKSDFAIWTVSIGFLLICYWGFWLVYFKNPKFINTITLAVIPSVIFILSGILLRHWLLTAFGAVFSVGHIYVTIKNTP